MISLTGVTRRFGRIAAVDGVDLHIGAGEAVSLWGTNGAGKTTLIRCVLGLLGFEGRITVDGIDARRRGKEARRLIGHVPQELAFREDMRLGEAMAFFASIRGAGRAEARELLARFGLAEHERKRVRELSGGMKQRHALAVAMLADPPVIIMDEPTSNLDSGGRREVVDALRGLRAGGKTLLFASHRVDEIISLADRVVVMERGRVVQDAAPSVVWPASAGMQTIRLHVGSGQESGAAALLREAGHAVSLNGHGLCVAVARDRKAVPIRVLASADVVVHDFEIMDDVSIREGRA